MAAKVTKEMIINDIIALDEGTVPILMESGMHCVGCPSARGESLEEACLVHGMDIEPLLERLNNYLATK